MTKENKIDKKNEKQKLTWQPLLFLSIANKNHDSASQANTKTYADALRRPQYWVAAVLGSLVPPLAVSFPYGGRAKFT